MSRRDPAESPASLSVRIPVDGIGLAGDLAIPGDATELVIFAHGSGSSRHSPRNRAVAAALQDAVLATLLLDLLTPDEEHLDATSGAYRFDIPLLASRLESAIDWAAAAPATQALAIALFGASTGAAAALIAAAARPRDVRSVVSRGGRPDLAGNALSKVKAPTLLIVGGLDTEVLALNRSAARLLTCEHDVRVVPGASHLFEERGALDQVATMAADWINHHKHSVAAVAD
jgi:dienelactone hydrolase